jgi:hypothetical protein
MPYWLHGGWIIVSIEEHLEIPVCQTKQGIMIHLLTIRMTELGKLCFEAKVDSIDALCEVMYKRVRGVKEG